MGKKARTASWALQLMVAVIFAQTLYFKFTAARESVYIFSALGVEPWGRIGSGVVELVAIVLLLVPRTVVYGAILSLGVICAAIVSHLTKLGVTIPAVDDRGELFGLAIAVLAGCTIIIFLRRFELGFMVPRSPPKDHYPGRTGLSK